VVERRVRCTAVHHTGAPAKRRGGAHPEWCFARAARLGRGELGSRGPYPSLSKTDSPRQVYRVKRLYPVSHTHRSPDSDTSMERPARAVRGDATLTWYTLPTSRYARPETAYIPDTPRSVHRRYVTRLHPLKVTTHPTPARRASHRGRLTHIRDRPERVEFLGFESHATLESRS
jgi:hypothetical protein